MLVREAGCHSCSAATGMMGSVAIEPGDLVAARPRDFATPTHRDNRRIHVELR
jgi:hypothetical protein